jgi:DNA-binding CsgD family transcriptional regulator
MSKFQLGESENLLLQKIYAAAMAPEKWPALILDVAHYIRAEDGEVLFYDYPPAEQNCIVSSKVLSVLNKLSESCSTPGCSLDNALTGAIRSPFVQSIMNVPVSNNVVWVEKFSDLPLSCKIHLALAHSDHSLVLLSFWGAENTDGFSAEACAFLQTLAPHIARALFIYRQMGTLYQNNQWLAETLKQSSLAVLLLNADFQVLFIAPEAQKILASNSTVAVSRCGYLLVGDAIQQAQFDKLLRQCLLPGATLPDNNGCCIPIKLPNKLHPLKLNILPFNQSGSSSPTQTRIAIFITDPERRIVAPAEYLRQAYGLTRTEVQVANLLINGCDLAAIASQRHTTLETTRWQIKSLMHKTSTNSQPELVRLLMLLSRESAEASALPDVALQMIASPFG